LSHIDTSANLNRWRKKSLAEKALLAIGMLLIAVSVPSPTVDILVSAIMIAATVLGAKVPFSLWWKAMTAPISFLFLAVLTLMFQVHAGWPFIGIAPHGLELAWKLGLRAYAGLNCLLFLALTTPAADLTAGLRKIGVPAEIVEMALLMYRFVFLLTDTAEAMNAAQAARLGHVTYRKHMHSLSLLIVNLMPRAFARAQALEVGLAARGWRGELRVLSPVRPASPAWIGGIAAAEVVVLLIGLYTR
jgi:cobalt/nickel transport system permease protein